MNVLSLIGKGHDKLVFGRRIRLLAAFINPLLHNTESVLDVGSGDGLLAKKLTLSRSDLNIEGIEVVVRPSVHIKTTKFDGLHIPFPDKSFDAVLLIDVLHHTQEPTALLREAARVARRKIIVKDHLINSSFSRGLITITDWLANRPHGVPVPFNFQSEQEWNTIFLSLGMRSVGEKVIIAMYPFPFNKILNWSHDFIVQLEH